MAVKLRVVGNSRTLTVPMSINTVSKEYSVENIGNTIVYTPIKKRVNIFSTPDWKNYDYRHDIENDVELQDVKPIGKELI